MPQALCAADPEKVLPSVYLTDEQISAQKATSSWASLVSKLHCSETSGLMERVGTKLGLLLSYTYCHAGLGQAEHKVRRYDGAELPRGCAAKQGSLQHGGLPQQFAVAAVIMHNTQLRHYSCISWSWRDAMGLCCKWVRHGLTTRERDESQRSESCSAQNVSSKTCLPAEQALSAAQALRCRS